MRLFGKRKLKEAEAVAQFVLGILNEVRRRWSETANDLNAFVLGGKPISDDQYAAYEFALAVFATQIQFLRGLLPEEQESRIRANVLVCLSAPNLGDYPRDTIQEYQNAWEESLRNHEAPFYGIASVLLEKLGCEEREVVEFKTVRIKNPLLLAALSEKVLTFSGPWWKNVTGKFDLVP